MQLIRALLMLVLTASIVFANWQEAIHGDPSVSYLASDSSGNRIIVSMSNGSGVWLTNDGGSNWIQINQRLTQDAVVQAVPYNDIVTVGAAADTIIMNIYHTSVTGETKCRQYHTLDGGNSWSSFSDLINDFWPDSIPNIVTSMGDPGIILPDRAYYMRLEGFGISNDNGETWEIVEIGHLHRGINGVTIDPLTPDLVIAYGSWGEDFPGGPPVGGVISSYDGGWTWSRRTPMEMLADAPHGTVTDVSRGPGDSLYACTTWSPGSPDSPFLFSADLGATWQWLAAEGLPGWITTRQLVAVPERPGRLLTSGPRSVGVWESNDNGQTFHRLLRGLPVEPTGVLTIYRNPYSGHLYIGLLYQGIYRSIDQGDTWQPIPGPPIGCTADSWYDVGLVVGEGGVLHGYNGTGVYYAPGASTEFQPVPGIAPVPDLEQWSYPVAYPPGMPVSSVRNRNIQTMQREQKIVYSTDDGANWIENECGYPGTFTIRGVEIDEELVIIGSEATRIDVSYDIGSTWEQDELPFYFPYALMFAGNYMYTVHSPSGQLIRSSDLGQSWESMEFPEPDELGGLISPILKLEDTLFVKADDDCWARLPDGSWQPRGEIYSRLTNGFFTDWDFVTTPEDTFLICGTGLLSQMFVSCDNGWSWEAQDVEFPGEYSGELAVELAYDEWRQRLWVSTNLGLIYMDLLPDYVNDVWRFQPASHVMLDSYPNPFNAATMIRYQLTLPSKVTLTVNDILGRQMATILQERWVGPGEHMVEFDASSPIDGSGPFSSGMYFLVLKSEEGNLQRRITLIK